MPSKGTQVDGRSNTTTTQQRPKLVSPMDSTRLLSDQQFPELQSQNTEVGYKTKTFLATIAYINRKKK